MMSMHKYSSCIEDQFGENFINFRPLSSENEALKGRDRDYYIIVVVVVETPGRLMKRAPF